MKSRQKCDQKLSAFIKEEKKYLNQMEMFDAKDSWERFQRSLERGNNKSGILFLERRNRLVLSRIAAAVLLLIATTTIIYFTRDASGNHIVEVNSEYDNTKLTLSEGSEITLRKGSVLRYPENLKSRKREVYLSGEAYFEVAGIASRPFYVYFGDHTVRVVGTSFNIREEGNGEITVSVLSGKVYLYKSAQKDDVLQLEAGQEGWLDIRSGRLEQRDYKSENFLFWMTGRLSYEFESLEIVFRELERYFNSRFIVEEPGLLENRVTTSFEGQLQQDILKELAMLFDLQFFTEGDTVYVRSKQP
jgi:ferric-dicitrate binding protein FerR (iron transport regulator)